MNNFLLNFRGGVLIIGSLLWDDEHKEWRRKLLDESAKIKVYVPIRYGRLCAGKAYTTSFSNSCRKYPGTAYLVPIRKTIKDFNQLVKEAQELSSAEGMEGRFIKSSNNIPWGVIGIQFNDMLSTGVRQLVSDKWEGVLKAEPDYSLFDHQKFGVGTENPCILHNGVLNFSWVKAVHTEDRERLNKYDFLLGVATAGYSTKYPTINKMVANVRSDRENQYFRKNNRHGITTYQDERILKKL